MSNAENNYDICKRVVRKKEKGCDGKEWVLGQAIDIFLMKLNKHHAQTMNIL